MCGGGKGGAGSVHVGAERSPRKGRPGGSGEAVRLCSCASILAFTQRALPAPRPVPPALSVWDGPCGCGLVLPHIAISASWRAPESPRQPLRAPLPGGRSPCG